MAERALTEEAMLAGLHDIRLPGDAPGGLAADLLAAAGLGLLLALGIAALLGLVTRARPRRGAAARSGAEPRAGDEAALRRQLLARLKRERPERYAELAGGLYRPGGLPEIEVLRAMLTGR